MMSKYLKIFFSKISICFLLLIVCIVYSNCKKNDKEVKNETTSLTVQEDSNQGNNIQGNLGEFESNINSINDNIEFENEQKIQTEEKRIATEIENIEAGLIDESVISMDKVAENIEEKLLNTVETKEIININDELLFMEYEDEIFVPQKTEYGWYIIHSQKENVERTKYDNDYRMIEKETWSIKSNIKESKILLKEFLSYYDETYKVKNKTVESEQKVQIINYNLDSQIENSREYLLKDGKKYISNQLFRKYDEKNRIINEQRIEYYYLKDFKKLEYKIEKKYNFFYNNADEIPADFDYYENGVLKAQNKYYAKKGTYTSHIFFDKDFSIMTYYIDEIRIKDVYYINKKIDRIKTYD